MIERLKWLDRYFESLNSEEPRIGRYFVYMYPPLTHWTSASVDLQRAQPTGEPFLIYTHIPFCQKHCDFCYYAVTTNLNLARTELYVDSLLHELQLYAQLPRFKDRPVSVIYVGGGTPSQLEASQIERLLKGYRRLFSLDQMVEMTFECAPRSVTKEKLAVMKEHGVTRVSMGIQQLDDSVLGSNGRVHVVSEIDRALNLIAEAGFEQVNVDLISGLVGQSAESFTSGVQRLIENWKDSLTGVTIYPMQILSHSPMIF